MALGSVALALEFRTYGCSEVVDFEVAFVRRDEADSTEEAGREGVVGALDLMIHMKARRIRSHTQKVPGRSRA